MKWSAKKAALAVKGTVVRGDAGRTASGISTDSRKLKAREGFVALRGERFDGHSFAKKTAEKGAAWIMAEKGRVKGRLPGDTALIEVKDTLQALGDLASHHRDRHQVKVAAVTGSLGKSSTKEMAAAIISACGKVLRNEGNLNNLVGLPLTLFGLNRSHRCAVLEMGCNRPGEIRRLARIAGPDVGLITRVAPVHLEGLGSIQGVARAKAELIAELGPGATFVQNLDDPLIARHAASFRGRRIGYTTGDGARFRGECLVLTGLEKDVVGGRPRIVFSIRRRVNGRNAGRPVRFHLWSLAPHDAMNALAACALGRAFGVSLGQAAEHLGKYRALKGRGEVVKNRKGAIIINDAYNSSPEAVAHALETMAWWRGPMRGVAVLGEMLELGGHAPRYHAQIGRKAAETGIDLLVARGPNASRIVEGAVKGGLSRRQARVVKSNEEASRLLAAEVGKGDWVLVKGSRLMGLETVAAALAR